MKYRREILELDPPYDFKHAIATIRTLTGWGTSDICFILNLPRSTLHAWEAEGCRPSDDHGQAIRKLLAKCRNSDTSS